MLSFSSLSSLSSPELFWYCGYSSAGLVNVGGGSPGRPVCPVWCCVNNASLARLFCLYGPKSLNIDLPGGDLTVKSVIDMLSVGFSLVSLRVFFFLGLGSSAPDPGDPFEEPTERLLDDLGV